PYAGKIARSIHVLEQVVHRQNVRATEAPRNPEQVGNVHQVALQPAHDRAKLEIPFQRVIAAGQRNGVKIRRQRTAFRHLIRRSNQKVFALAVEARQCAHHIPDVGAHAEFRHATDIDDYFHSLNLITGETRDTGNSPTFLDFGVIAPDFVDASPDFVIPNEVRDLHFAADYRSLTSFGMTRLWRRD